MSLQRVQRETTSEEFLEWMIVLEEEWNEHEKLDYYLAQIAREIRQFIYLRANSKQLIKLSDLLIPFEHKEQQKEETREEKIKRISDLHRAAIFGSLGLNSQGEQVLRLTEDGKMVRK